MCFMSDRRSREAMGGLYFLSHLQQHLHGSGSSHGGGRVRERHVPRGCLPVKVGQEGEGEQQQRFVVPVDYFNHPLFAQLLKGAEEEYGFDQEGAIAIPCRVAEFHYVQSLIDRENSCGRSGGGGHGNHHSHLVGCFRA